MSPGADGTAAVNRAATAAFVRPRAVSEPALRLVVVHHAGGSAATYFPLARLLPADWELLLLDLPGRGKSHARQPIEDMADLTAWAAETIRPWADGTPLALFGHSLGAVVAHEAARLLAAAGSAPVWLGVSGRAAPGQHVPEAMPDTGLPDDELMRSLTAMGGMHPRIDELPEFRARFLELVRSDLRAVAGYRPDLERPPLDVPLIVFGAAGDTVAPPHTLPGWGAQTRARFGRLEFDGGHFHFLGPALPDFADRLVEEIRQALRPAPVGGRTREAQLRSRRRRPDQAISPNSVPATTLGPFAERAEQQQSSRKEPPCRLP
jgi:surfactin synthase thioesterase subunit